MELKTIRIRAQIHREIDMERASTGYAIYELVEMAWEAYKKRQISVESEKTKEYTSFVPSDYSETERVYADRLLLILRSQSKDAIEAVTKNIDTFHRLAELDLKLRDSADIAKSTAGGGGADLGRDSVPDHSDAENIQPPKKGPHRKTG